MGICCEEVVENWQRYNDTAQYLVCNTLAVSLSLLLTADEWQILHVMKNSFSLLDKYIVISNKLKI